MSDAGKRSEICLTFAGAGSDETDGFGAGQSGGKLHAS